MFNGTKLVVCFGIQNRLRSQKFGVSRFIVDHFKLFRKVGGEFNHANLNGMHNILNRIIIHRNVSFELIYHIENFDIWHIL